MANENFISEIKEISFFEVYSSRGFPTTLCRVVLKDGTKFESTCPSGASTGSKEAAALTDSQISKSKNNEELSEVQKKFDGRSVKLVIKKAQEELIPQILKANCANQFEFDQILRNLDGTDNFSTFGANIILPLSICFSRMLAHLKKMPLHEYLAFCYAEVGETEEFAKLVGSKSKNLKENAQKGFPSPNFNILNGGAHSGNYMPFQEIMINFSDPYDLALKKATCFYNHLKTVITKKYGAIYTGYGDEGGYMPPIKTLDEAIALIRETNIDLGYSNLKIAVDSAANEFYKNSRYIFNILDEKGEIKQVNYTGQEMVQFYVNILKKFEEIYLLEDPFAENDQTSWKELTGAILSQNLGHIQILGDDLVVTNPKIIKQAITEKWCNSVLIKPNQIGTVTDTLISIRLAHENNFKCMVSHRSGETEDDFIADLSAGTCTSFIKSGAPRGERMIKYNKLLKIFFEKQ